MNNEANQHSKNFSKSIISNWFYYFLSAYTMYALFTLFTIDSNNLYFHLARPYEFSMVCLSVLALAFGCYFMNRFIPISPFELASICLSVYMISVCLKAPSPLIIVGFLVISIMIFTKLLFEKSMFAIFIGISFIIIMIKGIFLHDVNGEALQKFNYAITEKELALKKGLLIGLYLSIFTAGILLILQRTQFLNKLNNKIKIEAALKIFVIVMLILITSYTSIIMIGKELVMGFATYDKGLFTQMFESMRQGRGPMTSLERDQWMSHFHVHISPIFYLMLPFYILWPKPETLELLQVLVTMSGIIPLYFILKHFQFNKVIQSLFLLLFIVTPTLSSSHLYGLHENCFLTPLLLWLILENLKGWTYRLIIILGFTLLIKEDIMIYIIAIGLYFTFQKQFDMSSKRTLFTVLTQIIVPIGYFAICMYYLNTFGDGSMTTRFTNFMLPGQTGLKDVIINIFTNPTYFFSALFTFNKIKYIVTLLSMYVLLPLIQKHWISYILLLPMLVINLLSDFPYQADFGFQYHYGSTALLLFMTILAVNTLAKNRDSINEQHEKQQFVLMTNGHRKIILLLTCACIMSASIFFTLMHPSTYGIKAYAKQSTYFKEKKQTLKSLPQNKKILAYGFYTTQLAQNKYLYDLDYHNDKKIDTNIEYVVVPRALSTDGSAQSQLIAQYMKHGYKEYHLSTPEILILKR
ncbi:hypothetical protein BHU61_03350 [Macrococcus epidermidis]|uniref:DUF2079 domain-containing protein n=2 Tax=Macrococcus epidermidis TaxID=1902580 RepID=A0A327ZY95_9STAP|nr:hypothetical protein BHU61_03350 [Macrococcus epidermidis]